MSLNASMSQHGTSRFPRVSGDEPVSIVAVLTLVVFSPRERG